MEREGDSIDVFQNLEDNAVCKIKICDENGIPVMVCHLKANQPI